MPGELDFQSGFGANAKNPNAFGAYVWLNLLDPSGSPVRGHWDLNLNLALTDNPGEMVSDLPLSWSSVRVSCCSAVCPVRASLDAASRSKTRKGPSPERRAFFFAGYRDGF